MIVVRGQSEVRNVGQRLVRTLIRDVPLATFRMLVATNKKYTQQNPIWVRIKKPLMILPANREYGRRM